MAGGAAQLVLDVVANVGEAVKSLDKVKDSAGGGFSAMKAAAAVAGTAIVAGLGVAAKAGMEAEVALAKLSATYTSVGLSASDAQGAISDVEAAALKTGQSTDDAVEGYTKLVMATRNAATAHEQLAVAQDLAAFSGKSVSEAAEALVKANQGSTKELKNLGIATTDATGKALSHEQVMNNLTTAVKGQADAYGQTAAGSMSRFHETMGEVTESLGTSLLPALSVFAGMLSSVAGFLNDNQAIMTIIVPIVASLAGGVFVVTKAVQAWTAVQAALNLVMSMNPIGLVILAIAALVAGVILAYQHFQVFHDIVDGAWQVLQSVVSWVIGHWQVFAVAILGPLGLVLTQFDRFKQGVEAIVAALQKIISAASAAFGWLGKVGGFVGKLNPFTATGTAAASSTPMVLYVNVAPGDDFPERVYAALRTFQRRNHRPELAGLFS
jgi:hypothetical protein